MAASELKDFLMCPICLDTYTEPVSLSCHHSFCCSCLKDCWDKNQNKCCPVCHQKSSKNGLDINFSLREMCIFFRQKRSSQQQWMCRTHPEVPSLFCKDEARLLCPVCEFSLHAQSTVVSVEEAAMELKDKVTAHIQTLKDQRQSCEEQQNIQERLQHHAEDQAVSCTRQIKAVFEKLHRFIEGEQERSSAVLRREQLRVSHSLNSALQSLRKRLSSLSTSIQELEQRTHTDTWTLLKTDTEEKSTALCYT